MRQLSLLLRSLACFCTLLAAMLWSAGNGAHAQSRVALVVGNSNYTKVANLPNPAHDGEDVAAALRRLGFTVNSLQDADFNTFRRALLDFNRLAPSADIAVIYFAGHGIEVDGENWLLPIDVELHSDVDASNEAISLKSAMTAVGSAHTLGLVILDACRNNPFESTMRRSGGANRGMERGLAPVDPFENVLVAYSARDGTTANDGTGRNSPFTAALLRHIETPGLEIDFLFRNVRDEVKAATNNVQQPFVYGSLSSEETYLKPPVAGGAVADAVRPSDASEIAWSFLKATGDVATLTRFTNRFPTSTHVAEAKVRISSLEALPIASGADPGAVYKLTNYVQANDTGFENAEMAVARRFTRDNPAIEEAWNFVKDTTDHTLIRRFVEQFPSKKRRVAADTRLADLGQRPMTVRVQPRRLLNVDDALFAQAAKDQDVIECYRLGNQNDPSCQRAVERYPNIARFPEDLHFLLDFCAAIGKNSACLPTVKSDWNFPVAKTSPTSTVAIGTTPDGAPIGGPGDGLNPPAGSTNPSNGNDPGDKTPMMRLVDPGPGDKTPQDREHHGHFGNSTGGSSTHKDIKFGGLGSNGTHRTITQHISASNVKFSSSAAGLGDSSKLKTTTTTIHTTNPPNVKVTSTTPQTHAPSVNVNVHVPSVQIHPPH
jgi:hypothetical protein